MNDSILPQEVMRYLELREQLQYTTEAQAHAVLLHHDKVAGLLSERYIEILGSMGEVEANAVAQTPPIETPSTENNGH